ncbi:MAG: prephenate dehydrogenase/arogenate dehydrogenase family protein [Burkholderiaceae bacterium]|nr:prephenate dehydrogenase/arogenate dehydrogenase family protein [Burkholderiaceae bacterium]
MSRNQFGTVAIVGVGLIGGSIGLALKDAGVVTEVIGVGRSASNLEEAQKLGAIDRIDNLEGACKQAQWIVLCVPVAQMRACFQTIEPHLNPHTLITDAGSTKSDLIVAAKEILGKKVCQFVPAHPIAGGAHHGVVAAKANLFEGKQTIICQLQENSAADVALVESFWQALGSRIKRISAIQHDAIYAAVSHLPHLLSYALMTSVLNSEDAEQKLGHAGAGFRDFTRIAASSPEMWRDICLANKSAILQELDQYLVIAKALRELIAKEDSQALEKVFLKASEARKRWEES